VAATLLLTGIGYLAGSLMFSYWLGRMRGRDIRDFGDGNPGAVNAFRAGGARIGALALLLDFLKGFAPVFIATWLLCITDWRLVPIALAPVLGHAFPVFLRGRGGKGIATTFGIWSGITYWEVPVLLGAALALAKWGLRIRRDALALMAGLGAVLGYLILRRPEPPLFLILGLNAGLLVFTHRAELRAKR
jgi:acyl phosphate:glycerol-3-phosphate acyltransferase